ncbi:rhodanese-like domain-containing protein [Thermithiobacillus plumbiphilus]|uniref:Rhodanese-like domain-containing protein n=1 Tax=Thermithiobacillus plumbiphilus TaxID=1729899 RepID=A0ABU9D9W2_9PROT
MQHIRPQALKARLELGESPFLLDVREPWENQLVALPGSTLIPMGEVPARLAEIPRDQEVIVYCHHGVRSMQVGYFLDHHGVQVTNLLGGIDAWSLQADPQTPRY